MRLLSQSTRPTEHCAESREFKNDDPIFEIPELVYARRREKRNDMKIGETPALLQSLAHLFPGLLRAEHWLLLHSLFQIQAQFLSFFQESWCTCLKTLVGAGLWLLWSFPGLLKASRAASGLSAIQGTTGFSYLYVDVCICIVLACFQLGSGGRQKMKNNHTHVSHLEAYFSTSFFFSFPSWIFLSDSLVGERKVVE